MLIFMYFGVFKFVWRGGNFADNYIHFCKTVFLECQKHRKRKSHMTEFVNSFSSVNSATDAAVRDVSFARGEPLYLGCRCLVARCQASLFECTVDVMGRSLRLAILYYYYYMLTR